MLVNRLALILHPKQPFVDWVNSLDSDEFNLTLEQANDDLTIHLIHEIEPDQYESGIKANWKFLFEEHLHNWYTDEAMWPQKRTYAMFREWFDVTFHSMIEDLIDEPLEKEED